MLLKDFTAQIMGSEQDCLTFLRKHGIFDEAMMFCTRNPTGKRECGSEMKRTLRKNSKGEQYPAWRCTSTSCRTYLSIRSTNKFFSWDGTTNLSLRDIMMLVYIWLYNSNTIQQVRTMTGHSPETIVNWFFCFRQVCTDAMRRAPTL